MRGLFATTQDNKRIRLTTNTNSLPGVKLPILGTKHALFLPYSMLSPRDPQQPVLTLGPVRFAFCNMRRALKALDPIPASWFEDISRVLDLSE